MQMELRPFDRSKYRRAYPRDASPPEDSPMSAQSQYKVSAKIWLRT